MQLYTIERPYLNGNCYNGTDVPRATYRIDANKRQENIKIAQSHPFTERIIRVPESIQLVRGIHIVDALLLDPSALWALGFRILTEYEGGPGGVLYDTLEILQDDVQPERLTATLEELDNFVCTYTRNQDYAYAGELGAWWTTAKPIMAEA